MKANSDNPADVKVLLKRLIDMNINSDHPLYASMLNILTDMNTNGYNHSNKSALVKALYGIETNRDNSSNMLALSGALVKALSAPQGIGIDYTLSKKMPVSQGEYKFKLEEFYIENYTGIKNKNIYIDMVMNAQILHNENSSRPHNFSPIINRLNSEVKIIKALLRFVPLRDLDVTELINIFLLNYFNDAKEFFLSTTLSPYIIRPTIKHLADTCLYNSDYLDLICQMLISGNYKEPELWKIEGLIFRPEILSKLLKEMAKNDTLLSTDIIDTITSNIKDNQLIKYKSKLAFNIIKTLVETKGASGLPIFNINSEGFRTMLAASEDIINQKLLTYLYEHGLNPLENHTKVPVIVTDNQSAHKDEISNKAREQLVNLRKQFLTREGIDQEAFYQITNWAHENLENLESLANMPTALAFTYQLIMIRTLSEIRSYIIDLIADKADLRIQTITFFGDTVAVGVRTGEGLNTVTKLLDTEKALELALQAFNYLSAVSTEHLPFSEVFYLMWKQACKQEIDNHKSPYYYRSDILKVLAQIGCEYYKNESGIESVWNPSCNGGSFNILLLDFSKQLELSSEEYYKELAKKEEERAIKEGFTQYVVEEFLPNLDQEFLKVLFEGLKQPSIDNWRYKQALTEILHQALHNFPQAENAEILATKKLTMIEKLLFDLPKIYVPSTEELKKITICNYFKNVFKQEVHDESTIESIKEQLNLLIDLIRNSTSADDLYVDPVLESETNQKYAAGRGAVSPSNPLSEASFARGLISKFNNDYVNPGKLTREVAKYLTEQGVNLSDFKKLDIYVASQVKEVV
ncbi:hypothetical protein [Candidatus Trichorickettsia mobilis]|uniref:hypothetical protein n=1 Tax=Candidatus Trichorickettsia mobilis TaxID=1346319 RepID=UPI003977266E